MPPTRMPPSGTLDGMTALDLNRSLGARIAARRDQLSLDQTRLSLDARVDRRTVQRIEAGEVSPKVETLYVIAAALRTTMADLLEGLR